MRKPGDVKLTVTVSATEIIVNQAIYAGVDGPILVKEFDPATDPDEIRMISDTDQVDAWLRENGFERTTPWSIGRAYDGMYLKADLIERR